MTPEKYVVLGTQIYRIVRPFATWPSDLNIGVFGKCAVDSKNHLYVSQRADPPVIVFDRSGKFVRSIGDGRDADSHGIFITIEDDVLVVDRDAHQILRYSPDGRLISTLGESNRPRFQAPFSHPTDVTVSPDGDLYVADGYGNAMVHRFAADGRLKKSWGGRGTGPGQFMTPHGISILPDGRLLVGDRENNRIQVFDLNGSFLTEWTGFYHPMEIFVDWRGFVYVTDQRPSLTALDGRGKLVGSCKPAYYMPHGLTGDRDGNLFVVEGRNITAITKLEPV